MCVNPNGSDTLGTLLYILGILALMRAACERSLLPPSTSLGLPRPLQDGSDGRK